ncbi:MAG: hypothetical protein OXN86_12900 [Chloroflexota bacterium]|nr:hypothetical protein [Chloroflexota bacterium]
MRADELSQDFADVERAIEVELPLPPLRQAAALARLRGDLEAYEATRAAQAYPRPAGGTLARIAFVAAVAVLLIGGAAAVYFARDEPALTAEQVLDRAQESISASTARPSMATYAVEIAQLEPVSVTRKHELVIWTDPISGGYTSQLRDPDGSLRHAVWRRGADVPALAYNRAAGDALTRVDRTVTERPPTLLASMGNGIDCDLLASGFARWLEARRWHPLRVSLDFALLASDDATVRLERSGGVVFVVAQKQRGGLRAEVTLALDAESYEPHWLQIHFRSPQGESTFKLVQNEVRLIAASHLDLSVFEARVPSRGAVRDRSARVPRPRSEPAPDPLEPQVVEARLRHALHAAGACLGEPVEVVRGADGMPALRGIVGTRDMKEAILAALERSHALDSVPVDIRTREEAARDDGFRRDFDEVPFARPSVEAGGSSARSAPIRGLVLAADLTAYFRAADPLKSADSVEQDLGVFAGEAVERAEDLLRRAWALRRLGERYGSLDRETVSPEVADLVREMFQDHLHGLGASARAGADWTLPALGAIAEARGARERAPEPTAQSAVPASPWPEAFLSLFEAASSIHRDTLALLTVRLDVTEAQASAAGRGDSADVEDIDRTLRRLLGTSRALGPQIARIADAFAAGTHPEPTALLEQGTRR